MSLLTLLPYVIGLRAREVRAEHRGGVASPTPAANAIARRRPRGEDPQLVPRPADLQQFGLSFGKIATLFRTRFALHVTPIVRAVRAFAPHDVVTVSARPSRMAPPGARSAFSRRVRDTTAHSFAAARRSDQGVSAQRAGSRGWLRQNFRLSTRQTR